MLLDMLKRMLLEILYKEKKIFLTGYVDLFIYICSTCMALKKKE